MGLKTCFNTIHTRVASCIRGGWGLWKRPKKEGVGVVSRSTVNTGSTPLTVKTTLSDTGIRFGRQFDLSIPYAL